MMSTSSRSPVVLTIAGLDPSGGAGVLADVTTIAAFDCYPTAVITSITFQNSSGVSGAAHQSAEVVRAQLLPVLKESPVASVKTGMLPLRETVVEVVRTVREYKLEWLVVDPVMSSTSGHELMDAGAKTELVSGLIPLARLVTPNIPEAEKLVGFEIHDEAAMIRAAKSIRSMGAPAVLIKGGHLEKGVEVVDVLDDQGQVTTFRGERISGGEFRGTGCRLASGIAAGLAHRRTLEDSVRQARDFVTQAMRRLKT